MARKVLLQVLKSWNHGGMVLPIGARVEVEAGAEKAPIRLGYARKINPDEAYDYPATDAKHKFQTIKVDEPEPEPEPVEFEEITEDKKPDHQLMEGKVVPNLEDLEFLNANHIDALNKAGIKVLYDLKEWDFESLCNIKGIGKTTVDRLMVAYDQLVNINNHKENRLRLNEK